MRYSVIRKLDESDSQLVQSIINNFYETAAVLGWSLVNDSSKADVILVIGGDGTMLEGMRQSEKHGIPVVGFNIGKVGFLAEFNPNDAAQALIEIQHYFNISANVPLSRGDIRTVINEARSNSIAINEFVISPELAKDTIKYEFFIDGVSGGRHHANGLIVATPTGSTAYSLSVGGAIIQPNAPVFQIVPVAPMSLNSRSVVVSDSARIEVKIHCRPNVKYNLIADGQCVFTFTKDDNLVLDFVRGNKTVTLLHGKTWNFFTVLQEKLHWNTII